MDRQPTLPTPDTGGGGGSNNVHFLRPGAGEIKFRTENIPDSSLPDCVLGFVYIRTAIKSLLGFAESLRK